MKFNDVINILETIIDGFNDPRYMRNRLGESDIFNFTKGVGLNNSVDNNINVESENSNIEYNESVPREDSKSNNNESNGYSAKQQDTSSDPQGVIDSITQEITPVRLQQAIILSEIVGKPRSKTRKKRRF